MTGDHPDESSSLSPKMRNAFALVSALCDDRITPEQFNDLELLVCNDSEVGEFYVRLMHLNSSLHHFSFYLAPAVSPAGNEGIPLGDGPESGMNESMVLPAMSEQEPLDDDESQERFQPGSVLGVKPAPDHGGRFKPYLKGGLAALLVLGIGLFGHGMLSPKVGKPSANPGMALTATPPVASPTVASPTVPPSLAPPTLALAIPLATVNFTDKAVWEGANMPPSDGNFYAGQVLSLASGDIQLSLHPSSHPSSHRGGRLVIEGPAEVEFTSENKIFVHRGKIAATVPGGGLVVLCPNGSVTDLGTQFGVEVQPGGATDVAVFQGKVSASLTSGTTSAAPTTRPARQILLTAGQAAVMTDKAIAPSPEGAVPQRFICSLLNPDVSSLDVTDLVSGGDGTTRRRGIGISTLTGEIGGLPPVEGITGDGAYHRVSGYPVIDGAFVPCGSKPGEHAGEVVDSAGDTFNFSASANLGYNNIYTGGTIPSPNATRFRTALDGVDYSSPEHGIIFIHANGALTLNLDAIRRIYPDRSLTAFRCRVGNSCPAEMDSATKGRDRMPVAAAHVLVDGISRWSNPHFTVAEGSLVVNIPLKKSDHFLTLASTDAGRTNHHDWILWADAKLDLAAGN
jgi:hypothetical protein